MFHLAAQNPDATMTLGQLTRMVYLVVRALCVEQDTEVQVHLCLICYFHLQQLSLGPAQLCWPPGSLPHGLQLVPHLSCLCKYPCHADQLIN